MDGTKIAENLFAVQNTIKTACQKAGRDVSEVTLLAVSKTKPISMLQEIYELGVRDFGENKVQELCEKQEAMDKDIHWHMIGHLQRNKVKQVIQRASLIHSVDTIRLAEQIEIEASKLDLYVPILIEVNMANEASKYGIHPEDAEAFVQKIAKFPHISIKGLMTIAPFVRDPEENRVHFHNLFQLSVDIRKKNIDNVSMDILSMGMTNDYCVAIEEGATIVRVGTGIFGERIYK